MTETQSTAAGRVEATAQVKALAGRCVAEGLTAAEVTDLSEKVRAELGAYLRCLGGQTSLGGQTESVTVPTESVTVPTESFWGDGGQDIVKEDPRLTRFAEQYNRFSSEDRTRCPWQKVRKRLLQNRGRYLTLVEAMNGGGILFGVDREGNPLFADDGKEPIMTDMNYEDTRNAVYLKNPEGEWTDGNMTGYEMFPYVAEKDEYYKSDEMMAFEKFTEESFVVSPDRKEGRSSWVESGKNPVLAYDVYFDPLYGIANVRYDRPKCHDLRRGVRRLLRVKVS